MTESGNQWVRLPLRWIQNDHRLARFSASKQLGENMAALKLLVAILLRAENKPADEATVTQGSVSLSYDDLAEMTDLSRSMIAAGSFRLRDEGLIAVSQEGRGRRNRYTFNDYSVGAWGKIPYKRVIGSGSWNKVEFLHGLSCKRLADLNALKLYLALCAYRDRTTRVAMIGYEKLGHRTGTRRNLIRPAISILIEHGMIRVEHEKVVGVDVNTPNSYMILGL